jgi:hypothetical protein
MALAFLLTLAVVGATAGVHLGGAQEVHKGGRGKDDEGDTS